MTVIGRSLQERTVSAYVNDEITTIDLKTECNKGIIVLVFYPYDFTFVCPTEITGYSKMKDVLAAEGATILLVSCDSVYSHKAWAMSEHGGIAGCTLSMLSDKNGSLARELGIYVKEEGRSHRATFILHDGVIVYELVHADAIGRSTDELLRIIRALNYQKQNGGVCALDWKG